MPKKGDRKSDCMCVQIYTPFTPSSFEPIQDSLTENSRYSISTQRGTRMLKTHSTKTLNALRRFPESLRYSINQEREQKSTVCSLSTISRLPPSNPLQSSIWPNIIEVTMPSEAAGAIKQKKLNGFAYLRFRTHFSLPLFPSNKLCATTNLRLYKHRQKTSEP
jgi:hypothetical protein